MLPKGRHITPKWAWLWSRDCIKILPIDAARRACSSATAELFVEKGRIADDACDSSSFVTDIWRVNLGLIIIIIISPSIFPLILMVNLSRKSKLCCMARPSVPLPTRWLQSVDWTQYIFRPKRSAIRAQTVYFLHSMMLSVTCLRLSDVSVICRVTAALRSVVEGVHSGTTRRRVELSRYKFGLSCTDWASMLNYHYRAI